MTKMPTDYYWLVLWDGAMFLVIATYNVRMKGKKHLPGALHLTSIILI